MKAQVEKDRDELLASAKEFVTFMLPLGLGGQCVKDDIEEWCTDQMADYGLCKCIDSPVDVVSVVRAVLDDPLNIESTLQNMEINEPDTEVFLLRVLFLPDVMILPLPCLGRLY